MPQDSIFRYFDDGKECLMENRSLLYSLDLLNIHQVDNVDAAEHITCNNCRGYDSKTM